jgi:hypothetical protein
MNIIISIIVFSIVLFIYLHIYFQLKTSNDLEIYNIDTPSKDKFEEICDLKQPVLFNDLSLDNNFKKIISIDHLVKSYGNFDIKLINLNNITNSNKNYNSEDDSPLYVPVKFSTSIELFTKDKESKYYTENNSDFIEESCLTKYFRHNDGFLRPYTVSNCEYDIITGSKNLKTPLKYNITYRNYFIVIQGKIKVRLIPPKSQKYLYLINDYDNFNFYSPVNVWDPQDNYKCEFNKVKYLDIDVFPNNCLYIPPYWLYSILFDDNTLVCSFKYKTYMNTFSNIPKYFMKFLQLQNVKHKLYKNVDTLSFIKDNSNNSNICQNSNIELNESKKGSTLLKNIELDELSQSEIHRDINDINKDTIDL